MKFFFAYAWDSFLLLLGLNLNKEKKGVGRKDEGDHKRTMRSIILGFNHHMPAMH